MSKGHNSNGAKRIGKSSLSVLGFLELNPRATVEELSRLLGVRNEAVKKRIQRLRRSGALLSQWLVNSEFSQLPAKVVVLMTISHSELVRRKAPRYKGLRDFTRSLKYDLPRFPEWKKFFEKKNSEKVLVRGVYSIAGGGLGLDIIMLIEGNSEPTLRDFVTEVIAPLNGVVETNTAAVVAHCGT